ALYITEEFLRGTEGVCRVHGGGFAGTIQAFVPAELTDAYAAKMNAVFGEGSCHILSVRKNGACKVM
ncbi:MAG: galactokinase, partial [Clostridia bacterium]|nr:galactokinase [Clostridia bacterium]